MSAYEDRSAEHIPPASLRQAVAQDLEPARPLFSPSRRAVMLLPLMLLTVAAVPMLHFLRSDLDALGVFGSWGLSMAEAVCGLTVIALALREAIPGRALSQSALTTTFAVGLLVPFVVLGLTAKSYAIGAPPGSEWFDGVVCLRTSATAAVPGAARVCGSRAAGVSAQAGDHGRAARTGLRAYR